MWLTFFLFSTLTTVPCSSPLEAELLEPLAACRRLGAAPPRPPPPPRRLKVKEQLPLEGSPPVSDIFILCIIGICYMTTVTKINNKN
jgi:hypothetical protein